MSNSLIIDNWLLQDVGSCLTHGLNLDTATEITISQLEDRHTLRDVPFAGVQLEALLGFLVDIVFRDSLIVDSDFTSTWSDYQSSFASLLKTGLVRALPFRAHDDRLRDAKRFALDRLCLTSTLREAQRRNEESWATHKKADDPYMSAVIWGTAGMLSRSHVFEAPYSGHPLRKRVIEQTILAAPTRDMVAETLEWLSEERLRLYEVNAKNGLQRTATLVLPPVAIEIIEEAKDISQLIPVAYQLREKYVKMRDWLNSVQTAMDTEDSKEIAKYKKILHAVSNDLNRVMGEHDRGKVNVKLGWGRPSISITAGTLQDIVKKFGMRAMLNNQIFVGHGRKSLKRLLRMFGEETSSLGFSAQAYVHAHGK